MSDPAVTVVAMRGPSPYDVVIGHGLVDRLPELLGETPQRVAVIYPENLQHLAQPILEVVGRAFELTVLPVPEGEQAKTPAVAASCWDALGEAGFTRSDAVLTVGGGATTDLGGFVAATWLRGVRVVHVPTTLLGMVDAAVGGKTGVNTRAGKNLVGSFHEPAGVLCDLAHLADLPRADFVAGLGEVIKCGFIADPRILELIEATDATTLTHDSTVTRELIERAIQVKVDVVAGDLKEAGGREVLNYGHTLAHAIERAEEYAVRHGDAVAVGCVFVAELARLAGSLDQAVVDRHRAVLHKVGLPVSYDGAGFDALHAAMRLDKKSRGSQLRFVVLDDVAKPRILAAPDEQHLRAAYALVSGGAA